MIINYAYLSDLNPCIERLKHYKAVNGTKDFTVEQFLDLENITYSDKIWVAGRLMSRSQSILFAILCVESTLPVYEDQNSGDTTLRDCVKYLKTIKDFTNLTEEEKSNVLMYLDLTFRVASTCPASLLGSAASYVAYGVAYLVNAVSVGADNFDDTSYSTRMVAMYTHDSLYAYTYTSTEEVAAADAARQNQQNLILSFLKTVLTT